MRDKCFTLERAIENGVNWESVLQKRAQFEAERSRQRSEQLLLEFQREQWERERQMERWMNDEPFDPLDHLDLEDVLRETHDPYDHLYREPEACLGGFYVGC